MMARSEGAGISRAGMRTQVWGTSVMAETGSPAMSREAISRIGFSPIP